MPREGRKEQILQAAKALFSARGYHGTTVRDIAGYTGMLSGSLYAHISSKQDLLYEIMKEAADRFLGALRPIATGPGSAREKLRQAIVAHVQVVAGSLDAATVFLQEWRHLDGPRRADIQARRDEYEALLAGILRQGVAAGEFRPVDEKCARFLILGAANWLYTWYDPQGPLSPQEVGERFADLVLGGLEARPGP